MLNGSEFVQSYAGKGPLAWEAAALALSRQDGLTPWPWVDLTLTDGEMHAVIKVQSDVLSIGPTQDFVRLPLTPTGAQNIFNLFGWLMPTPWLVYQIWKHADIQLSPHGMVPNKGANLAQYAEHSGIINQQLLAARASLPASSAKDFPLLAGIKKHVIVSNIAQPGKVLIFGWYRPSPPAPDAFDDRKSMEAPDRQPIQPKSNVHGDFYVDYSHGIQAVAPTATVNAPGIYQGEMSTVDLYQHPVLCKLVSNEGPVRLPRYPCAVLPPTKNRPATVASYPAAVFVSPTSPSASDWAANDPPASRKKEGV